MLLHIKIKKENTLIPGSHHNLHTISLYGLCTFDIEIPFLFKCIKSTDNIYIL